MANETDETGAGFLEQMNRAIASLAEKYEVDDVDVEVPQRYRQFFETGEYKKYASASGVFYDSPHRFKFTDDYLISHFASSEIYDGILDRYDDDQAKAFALRPFTQLWDGPGKSSSVALFIDLSTSECPIRRFDEGQLRPVAASLDEFLSSLSGGA